MFFTLSHGGLIALTAFFFEFSGWFIAFRMAFLPKTFFEEVTTKMFD